MWILLGIALFSVLFYLRGNHCLKRGASVGITDSASKAPINSISTVRDEFQTEIKRLAKRAWQNQRSLGDTRFLLEPYKLEQAESTVKAIEIMLRHAERVAPGLCVPHLVPRIVVDAHSEAAGQFLVDDAGWVTIKVRPGFFVNKSAAYAILAHEICHYILENSGMRLANTERNERYTDMCMFVCGFGRVFLKGYKRHALVGEYRIGHRLGYLTDSEFRYADSYVLTLRQSNKVDLPGQLEMFKKEISRLIPDARARERVIQHARGKHPDRSEEKLYSDLIEQLKNERR